MYQALPVLMAAAEDRFGPRVLPRRRAERAVIDQLDVLELTVFVVFPAIQHRDPDYGWTALGVPR